MRDPGGTLINKSVKHLRNTSCVEQKQTTVETRVFTLNTSTADTVLISPLSESKPYFPLLNPDELVLLRQISTSRAPCLSF